MFVEEVRFCYNMDEIRKIGQIIRYMERVFSLWSGKIAEDITKKYALPKADEMIRAKLC